MGRRFWRTSALAGLLGAFLNLGVGIDIAAAHPGHDGHETDIQHAEQDLADTSIGVIEEELGIMPRRSKKLPATCPAGAQVTKRCRTLRSPAPRQQLRGGNL